MTDLEKYCYRKAQIVACKYYKLYKNIYNLEMLSSKDLIQEANVTVLEILNNKKYKDQTEKELKQIINRAIRNKLNMIKHNIEVRIAIYKKLGCKQMIEGVGMFYEESNPDTAVSLQSFEEIETEILYDQLMLLLSKTEFDVLYKTIVEGKSFREVGKEMNMTHPTISTINKQIQKKLKKFIKDNGGELI